MKIGIVGVGAVGAACAMALLLRGCAREIVLVDRIGKRAKAVATDMRYGTPVSAPVAVRHGAYADLAGADLVMITAGVNEKGGGATDRGNAEGRLKLLDHNADIYRSIVPELVRAAPRAVLLVVTDPPDPLADLTRDIAGHDAVLSTGTFLDTLRFRVHLAEHFGVGPAAAEAQVLGEHGTSEVFLWSSARIGGVPVAELLRRRGEAEDTVRTSIERDVRYANITIIEGNDASQYGIGMVCARIAEVIRRDERVVIPIGVHHPAYGVTLSLPSVVGRGGAREVLEPALSGEESAALRASAETLKRAVARIRR
jgi:L-lactate dehydrogenase